MSSNVKDIVQEKLKSYKQKYFTNLLIKGSISFISTFFIAILIISFVGYYSNLSQVTRALFFFLFFAVELYFLIMWIAVPIYKLINLEQHLSNEIASKNIGNFFSEVSDKLLNTIQLSEISGDNILVSSSINQKWNEIKHIDFNEAIPFDRNRGYAFKYLFLPSIFIIALLLFKPFILTKGSEKILLFNRTYVEEAPFSFSLETKNLHVLKNESIDLALSLSGENIPEEAYIIINGRKQKLNSQKTGKYSITLKNLYENTSFQFEAAGYKSKPYELKIVNKPSLESIESHINYPKYLNIKRDIVTNQTIYQLPEGTTVSFFIKTEYSDHFSLIKNDSIKEKQGSRAKNITWETTFKNDTKYKLVLKNDQSSITEAFDINITVTRDAFPSIKIKSITDTILYNQIMINGTINDDYGFTKLRLFYKKENQGTYTSEAINFNKASINQTLFHVFNTEKLNLKPGERLDYYISVWDNDAVNGFKKSSSTKHELKIPDRKNIDTKLEQSSEKAEKEIDKTFEELKELKKKMDEFTKKTKGKKELDWEDKKELEKLIDEHKKLNNKIEDLQNELQNLNEQKEMFEPQNDELKKKAEQLQELMDELLDEETKKLYEELEKLLNEKIDMKELNDKLKELNKKDENLEKELDRSLELFKQLKFEQDLEKTKNKLEELAKEQEKLAQKSKDKETDKDKLLEEQEKLNEEFEDLKKELDDLEKQSKELDKKMDMSDINEESEDVKDEQKKSSESLKSGKKEKASESQKSAAEKMKKMAKQMEAMQMDMASQETQENIEDLRYILDNLIYLSFEQERIMKEIKSVRQIDPRFIELSQSQLKIQGDMQIVEDSLIALSKRVFEIKSVITRELTEINSKMDESMEVLRMRKPNLASSKMQYTMKSMNNLALLLDNVLDQLQQQMAQQKAGDQMCNKPGKGSKPKAGDMQKQLGKMIQNIKDGKKSSQKLSEALAKMAAQQEKIRRALKQLEQEGKGKPGGQSMGEKLAELEKLMKENEKDIVYNKINNRTIERQKKIEVKLLEAEKASKEQEYEKKRKAETASQQMRKQPKSFEEYIKEKEKQVEILKTVPPNMNPYYKKKVGEYFKEIEK